MKKKLLSNIVGVILLALLAWFFKTSPFVKPNDVFSYFYQYAAGYSLLLVAMLFITIPWGNSKISKGLFIITLIIFLPGILYLAILRKGSSAISLIGTVVVSGIFSVIFSLFLYSLMTHVIVNYWTIIHLKHSYVSVPFFFYFVLFITNLAMWLFGHRIYALFERVFGDKEVFQDQIIKRILFVNFLMSFIIYFLISAASSIGEFEEQVKAILDAVKDASGVFTAFYGVIAILKELRERREVSGNPDR
jgi:hypothetical protein